jgi:hypothetical protein
MMMNWKKGLEGSICGLMMVLSQNFPAGTEENYKKPQSGVMVFWLRPNQAPPECDLCISSRSAYSVSKVHVMLP